MERRRFIKGLTVLAAAPVILPLLPEAAPDVAIGMSDTLLVHNIIMEESWLLNEAVRFRNFNYWIPFDDSVYGVMFYGPRHTGMTQAFQYYIKHGKYPPPYELLNKLIYAQKKEKVWLSSTVEEMETLPKGEGNYLTSLF